MNVAIQSSGLTSFTLRFATYSVGLAAFVFGLLAIGPWQTQTPPGQEVRAAIGFAIVMFWPILNAGIATRASAGAIRWINGAYALGYLGCLVGYLLAGKPGVDALGQHWLISVVALPGVAAMTAFAHRASVLGWAYLVAISALTTAVSYRASVSPARLIEAMQTGLYAFAYSAFFVGFAYVALRASSQLDSRVQVEARAQAASAASAAGERERARLDALVHDSVISTLLMAGRGTATTEELANQARLALTALQVDGVTGLSTASDLAERLSQLRLQLAPSAQLSIALGDELAVPQSVAMAITGASAESLRNAVRHAGEIDQTLNIWIEFTASSTGLSVIVRDDGRGFNPAEVSAERMGISLSIVARMEATDGGSACVESSPGQGTRVSIEWMRP